MNMTNRNVITRTLVYISLAAWFLIALRMGVAGAFSAKPGLPPSTLGLAVLVPIALYSIVYADRGAFWKYCQTFSLPVITVLHLWRIIGADFLLNWYKGRLPAGFAFPAGGGDIIVALTAIPLAYAISKNARAARPWFVAWNVFGLLDLIVAIGSGILHSGSSIGLLAGNGPTTVLMSQFPRSLIPTFFVPLFMLLHLLALSRRRELGESDKPGGQPLRRPGFAV
jgi:hypothetical protein